MNRKSASSVRIRQLPTPRDQRVLTALRVHTHLTARHVRLLFFRKNGGHAAPQVVNVRLRKLIDGGFITALRVDYGRGAGPYAYSLSLAGRALLGVSARRGRPAASPVWHDIEVADFRVALEDGLHRRGGRLVEWIGEPQLRSLIRQRDFPVPDGLVYWRMRDREGALLLEDDRGTEPLSALTTKLERYEAWFGKRGHRGLLPGLGLRPRLAIVLPEKRAVRLIHVLHDRKISLTVFVGSRDSVLLQPLARIWWRSDRAELSGVFLF